MKENVIVEYEKELKINPPNRRPTVKLKELKQYVLFNYEFFRF